MKALRYATLITIFAVSPVASRVLWQESQFSAAQPDQHDPESHRGHAPPPKKALGAAHGARVKILSPKKGQAFKGNAVPLSFALTKGKRGHHVHAYIDGHLMGMFQSEQGTLTGIQPGHHILELRVVADDHKTELNATDTVDFMIK
ncbi:MAG: hypothetical protein HY695_26025 [Deltaproteobacteria bacterium]|nr:hypothetical protein [Deltaproteobacteria bacterium]